jgi:malonate transporter
MLGAFGPIWLLAAAGYAAHRWRLLGDGAVAVLGWFVFHVAMPAALVVTLAARPLAGFDARPVAAFAASTALVIGAGWLGASRLFDRKPGERAIWGMTGGYVNSANLGSRSRCRYLAASRFWSRSCCCRCSSSRPSS